MKMNLSKETYNTLKNFATINKSIVIDPGSYIRTISVNKNIYASAKVNEDFPTQVAIYDLPVFLSGISLFTDPVLDFTDDRKVIVSDQNRGGRTSFYYSDPDLIVRPPNKEIPMTNVNVEFTVTAADLDKLSKASQIYAVPDLCLTTKGNEIILRVCDKKNETSNTFEIPVGECDQDTEFCYCFKVENLRLQQVDYDVSISGGRVAHFVAKSAALDLQYFIALEPETK